TKLPRLGFGVRVGAGVEVGVGRRTGRGCWSRSGSGSWDRCWCCKSLVESVCCGAAAGDDVGSAVPDFDFARAMSALSMNPSLFKSSRKLELLTALPDCDFVCAMSAESTKLSLFVSPMSTPIVLEKLPV